MKAATLTEARAAKEKLLRKVAKRPDVNGVGITRGQGGYGLKVNLSEDTGKRLPTDVDGVPVRVEVVGTITKSPTARSATPRRRSA
jgi:PII-like signaling protein